MHFASFFICYSVFLILSWKHKTCLPSIKMTFVEVDNEN
jgi:hypothetical protein